MVNANYSALHKVHEKHPKIFKKSTKYMKTDKKKYLKYLKKEYSLLKKAFQPKKMSAKTYSWEECLSLLTGSDEGLQKLQKMANDDNVKYDNPASSYINIVRNYWYRLPEEDLNWTCFYANKGSSYHKYWKKWLVDRGKMYVYVTSKFKEAAKKGHCHGWDGEHDLYVKYEY